jgi:hypothetical protein
MAQTEGTLRIEISHFKVTPSIPYKPFDACSTRELLAGSENGQKCSSINNTMKIYFKNKGRSNFTIINVNESPVSEQLQIKIENRENRHNKSISRMENNISHSHAAPVIIKDHVHNQSSQRRSDALGSEVVSGGKKHRVTSIGTVPMCCLTVKRRSLFQFVEVASYKSFYADMSSSTVSINKKKSCKIVYFFNKNLLLGNRREN